ncbi:PLP-dependent transferase [Aspergillus aculeatinus CBS 121060]|uniref:PLP-dependent transferase n=1 Tax=Aspergillus aculeatinus CBS 121060 TaxID=1448322 RepID=A0ACD1GSR0_9EURO|nr:PLP-dependent transferase [Aspergillus aculeatinus CBS 121060]RAH64386.1 PLP-dependent transferase [Aspergillus aculeatinus CBS 121060]
MSSKSSVFATVAYTPPDAIFELTKAYIADPDTRKVNLGQGTYRDGEGNPWVLPAVEAAKDAIKNCNHEYLPILGHPPFRQLVTELVFRKESTVISGGRVASCQALSGTGALHVAGMLLRRALGQDRTVYITNPSWSNHRQVFESVGFSVREFHYASRDGIDMESLLQALTEADPSSIFVLHASAHNPTGWDPSPEQWRQIAAIMKERSLFPLFDAAYLGLTSGDYEQDAYAIRYFAGELDLEMGVCISFAKSMGLYGERTGLCAFVSRNHNIANNVESSLAQLVRSEISNPPAFGARVVTAILANDGLSSQWRRDLTTMSSRISGMRKQLCDELTALDTPGDWRKIIQQKGMFCVLGLTPEQVHYLKEKYHIYMAESSRVSIAGLNEGNVRYVAECIHQVVCQPEE